MGCTSVLIAGCVVDRTVLYQQTRKVHKHYVHEADNYCPTCGKYLWTEIEIKLNIGIKPFPITASKKAFLVGKVILSVDDSSAQYTVIPKDFEEDLKFVREALGDNCNSTLDIYLLQIEEDY